MYSAAIFTSNFGFTISGFVSVGFDGAHGFFASFVEFLDLLSCGFTAAAEVDCFRQGKFPILHSFFWVALSLIPMISQLRMKEYHKQVQKLQVCASVCRAVTYWSTVEDESVICLVCFA